LHINYKEVLAAYILVARHASKLAGRKLLLMIDNWVAIYVLTKRRSKSPILHALVKKFFKLVDSFNIKVMFKYVPTQDQLADGLSRLKSHSYSDEWALRPDIIDFLDSILPCNTDGCVAPGGYNALYDEYTTDLENFNFDDRVININPPYSELPKFIDILIKKKVAFPHSTIRLVTPAWVTRGWHKRLSNHAKIIHVFPAGTHMFTNLHFNFKTLDWEPASLGPTRWPVHIWKL
jgi:hypothetical protein